MQLLDPANVLWLKTERTSPPDHLVFGLKDLRTLAVLLGLAQGDL